MFNAWRIDRWILFTVSFAIGEYFLEGAGDLESRLAPEGRGAPIMRPRNNTMPRGAERAATHS